MRIEHGWEHAAWRKSSFSGSGANCVEAAYARDLTGVRDSKNPEHGALVFERASWLSFTRSFKP